MEDPAGFNFRSVVEIVDEEGLEESVWMLGKEEEEELTNYDEDLKSVVLGSKRLKDNEFPLMCFQELLSY